MIGAAELAAIRAAHPRVFRRSAAERLRLALAWTLFLAVLAFGLWRVLPGWEAFAAGLGKLGFLVRFMIPPTSGGHLGAILHGLAETLAMAFMGTLLAAVAAVPLGFAGARNVMPVRLLHFGLRRLFDGLRGIDSLIWAILFVAAVGMGPFAGILALAVPDTGTLAKLFAEAIENVEKRQVEGIEAAGSNAVERARFGILPQVLPVMLSHLLYFFESNTRSATILGVVGAGGIGLQLAERIRLDDWQEVAFIILLILATVAVIDWVSGRLRRRIIAA
ncbi:phosphonate ABC transporter, permease protein PhnE [Elioraea sp. Yellowstone]|mgnify:FL=1|jgi:phosphonate transport system permease protein|uniref:phosphonate ABC transporter, permease protein PhnE n=1 Tax=Elioraea sp. Yellowstone TaxID=2592070 RepID=UPI001153FE41|nr:phosphonate ABC transporter, permease protein PhnE [Elioraea sp. Yellowstone]TQF80117.1 phosphonate ABC transporter, permease protein PhnE [Elioraea sp. Yellowstone]